MRKKPNWVGKSASATLVSRSAEELFMPDYWETYSFNYNSFRHRMDSYLVPLLLKLGVMASIASVLARSNTFKSMLMRENRTMNQRLMLALWLSIVFGVGVAIRVMGRREYQPADLGLEGSLLAGIIGGGGAGLRSPGIQSVLAAVLTTPSLILGHTV